MSHHMAREPQQTGTCFWVSVMTLKIAKKI